jgi:hypothetical protein
MLDGEEALPLIRFFQRGNRRHREIDIEVKQKEKRSGEII